MVIYELSHKILSFNQVLHLTHNFWECIKKIFIIRILSKCQLSRNNSGIAKRFCKCVHYTPTPNTKMYTTRLHHYVKMVFCISGYFCLGFYEFCNSKIRTKLYSSEKRLTSVKLLHMHWKESRPFVIFKLSAYKHVYKVHVYRLYP